MSTAKTREQEAKFEVAPVAHAGLFANFTVDGYTFHPLGTVTQTDIYLDTPAFDLLRHGISLRVRHHDNSHEGDRFEVGIKSIHTARKGMIQTRTDIAIPLPAPLPAHTAPLKPSTWPTSVAHHLGPYTAKLKQVRPLFTVRQRRQKAHLVPLNGDTPLAEWSLDEVWIGTAPAYVSEESDFPFFTHFHELEIEELVSDGEEGASQDAGEAFAALVDDVQQRFGLKPVYRSKFVRGLEGAVAHAHENMPENANGYTGVILPAMPLEAAGRLLLHQQLLQMMLNEQGVREGKRAKYLHDLRVAIRRARAALTLCQDVFPPKTLARHSKALKELGRVAGIVRDLDVTLANLRAFRRSQPQSRQRGIKLLRAEIEDRRTHARKALEALLDSKKQRRFVAELSEFCVTPPATNGSVVTKSGKVQPHLVGHTLPSRLLAAFEAVRAYKTLFSQQERPSLESFHALRLAAKYLRYLLEFVCHLLGTEGEMMIEQLQTLQEHLGQFNDAFVEQERLRHWESKVRAEPELRTAIDTRLAQVTAHLEELAACTPSHLERFVSLPNREQFAQALARL